jgi:hypothetical protein
VAAGVNALEDLSVTTHSMPWFWVLVGGLGVALVSGSRFRPVLSRVQASSKTLSPGSSQSMSPESTRR